MSLDDLAARWASRRVVALTGAGISTESGIPDYRGEGTRARARRPIQHDEFINRADVRRRYWARSYLGYKTIGEAVPNAGHRALVELERAGALEGIITQNVDRLHTKAGSRRVIELHGALADVVCLACRATTTREVVQTRLVHANAGWTLDADAAGALRPDGDRELADGALSSFAVVDCEQCGGVLKPDVVFFGGAVAKDVVESAWTLYRQCELLVVIGSSLAVFSGYRFVRQADKDGIEVAIINRGESRGDSVATVKLDSAAGATLETLAARLV